MSAHKNFLHTSDFIVYSHILIAGIFEYIFPTDLYVSRTLSVSVGIVILLFAWVLIFITKQQFKKTAQKTSPGNETKSLIQDGIFAYTRNPIYVSMILISFSLGFILNSLWILVVTIPIFITLKNTLVLPEEKYLKETFKEEFDEYCKRVGRWF